MSQTYNGWANYATWRVMLEMFDGMSASDITGRSLPEVSELREACKEWAEQIIEDTTQEGLGRDYALAFLNQVEWWEIAEHVLTLETDEA